jgi:hypothetical protein
MNDDRLLNLLRTLYQIHGRVLAELAPACGKGCAACCTRDVTMTTLEGRFMLNHLHERGPADWLAAIRAASREPIYRPLITINQLAGLCATGQRIPEQDMNPEPGRCPFLTQKACSVYAVRPFGCRAMISTTACCEGGEADMPDFVLSANTVFQQYIEALDAGGRFGNMIEVLIYLQNWPEPLAGRGLSTNLPIGALMIPPEHRARMAPVAAAIRQAIRSA